MRQYQRLTIWSGCPAHGKAPKEPPDASPAQATMHPQPRTAGRNRVAQLLTRSRGQCLHASASMQRGTRLTHDARPRRQAPPPRTHAGAQAPAAHPRRTRAPRTQERPEHTCPCTHPARPRKQASLHTAAARAGRRQQDRGQCICHGIGRLCILYSVIFVRGNSVIHRGQKPASRG
jgi:hypothetical protein